MTKMILPFLLGIAFLSCSENKAPADSVPNTIQPQFFTFPVNSSVRAIKALDAQTLWYAGQQGQFGYTLDGGQSWYIDSISVEGYQPGFRAIDITEEGVFLLSTDSPALLFKSTDAGKIWEIVYREDHPDTYYNAIAFWDAQSGIAVGDAINSCLSIIVTRDGGNSWEKLPCEILPAYIEGEGGFAASNTNVVTLGDQAWIGTGGASARVFYTADRGNSWEAFPTPINQGGNMTGIFSVAFHDEKNGIVFGGDWEDQAQNTRCKAITKDGGRTWQLLRDGAEPAYRSCVQYVPHSEGQQLFAVGIPGISYSADGGQSWQKLSEESFYTIRITDAHSAWLAGKNKIARMSW